MTLLGSEVIWCHAVRRRLAGAGRRRAWQGADRENCGAHNTMQRRCAERGLSREALRPAVSNGAECKGATGTGDGERALVTVQILELGLGGKFQAKSSGWDENRTFLEGDVLVVAVRNGRWVLTHLTHGPRPAAPAPEHYFPTEE